jgi:GNAT superfamily N-acetyltransferase
VNDARRAQAAWQSNPLTQNPWDPPPLTRVLTTSPRDNWALAKQIDGLGGEWTYDLFAQRAANFHMPMAVVPYFYEPVGEFHRLVLEARLQELMAIYGIPMHERGRVSVSLEYFASTLMSEDGNIELPVEQDRYMGRHSVRIVGVPGQDRVSFLTPWKGWAQGDGYGELSSEYFRAHGTAAYVSRPVSRGPLSVSEAEQLLAGPGERDFARLWRGFRPSGRISAHGDVAFEWFSCWSLVNECPAEVLTLTLKLPDAERLRVGCAVVLYDRDRELRESEVIELFIWPPYRRRGYGTRLDEFVAHRATAAASRNVTISVWDADCVAGEDAALGFLTSRGYKVESFEESAQERHLGTRPLARPERTA